VDQNKRYITKKHPVTGEWGIHDTYTGAWLKEHPDSDPGHETSFDPPGADHPADRAAPGQGVLGCLVVLALILGLGACINTVLQGSEGGGSSDSCEERKERVNNMPEVEGTIEDDARYLEELQKVLEDCHPEFFTE
jgi:hypothetical protein